MRCFLPIEVHCIRFEVFTAVVEASQSTRRPNPEEHHQNRHRRENLRSHKSLFCLVAFNKYSNLKLPALFYGSPVLLRIRVNSSINVGWMMVQDVGGGGIWTDGGENGVGG
jgi:hypothetical protein